MGDAHSPNNGCLSQGTQLQQLLGNATLYKSSLGTGGRWLGKEGVQFPAPTGL